LKRIATIMFLNGSFTAVQTGSIMAAALVELCASKGRSSSHPGTFQSGGGEVVSLGE
jgi:hypothetical protein